MRFAEKLRSHALRLDRRPFKTLQINVGKKCNQACHHCHVEAGPKRKEMMDERTALRLIELLKGAPDIDTVDLTGGAPELNPHFSTLVRESRNLGKQVMDRCNLTVLFEKGQENTANFLKEFRVQIVASLPCYTQENVDHQRGNGVFQKSIEALKLLNSMGYGKPATGLILNLVYNPGGAFLPGPQAELEQDYKKELKEHFGIEFNHLFTITNMPIHRFLKDLERSGEKDEYLTLLENSFNPGSVENLMCRDLISVSWDGYLYDCDFNQMLELPAGGRRRSIWEIESLAELTSDTISIDDHCYGCTAGAGSSCGGALVSERLQEK